ncbi:PREDICTED: proline-rich extensin-like protein EPR1 [Priapulus caudatus]|uniref:Proline-rich extensin-like protein EPR1 n=1 Tax=Priapulus caudatus TaxID=37621 RepID=A0ABM1F2D7_PRICU|nr:PREDICTED: proline-rich extensin-like protein EPR1 [Priapulus caudatus]
MLVSTVATFTATTIIDAMLPSPTVRQPQQPPNPIKRPGSSSHRRHPSAAEPPPSEAMARPTVATFTAAQPPIRASGLRLPPSSAFSDHHHHQEPCSSPPVAAPSQPPPPSRAMLVSTVATFTATTTIKSHARLHRRHLQQPLTTPSRPMLVSTSRHLHQPPPPCKRAIARLPPVPPNLHSHTPPINEPCLVSTVRTFTSTPTHQRAMPPSPRVRHLNAAPPPSRAMLVSTVATFTATTTIKKNNNKSNDNRQVGK